MKGSTRVRLDSGIKLEVKVNIAELSKFNYIIEIVKRKVIQDILSFPHLEEYVEAQGLLKITFKNSISMRKTLIRDLEKLNRTVATKKGYKFKNSISSILIYGQNKACQRNVPPNWRLFRGMNRGRSSWESISNCVYFGSFNHKTSDCLKVLDIASWKSILKKTCFNCTKSIYFPFTFILRGCRKCTIKHHASLWQFQTLYWQVNS